MNLNVSLALKNKECTGHVVCPHILVLILEVESIFHKFSLKCVTMESWKISGSKKTNSFYFLRFGEYAQVR